MPFFLSHPAAAWLLPAVALPILFHLFFRLRRQVREFPSLMFFLRIDPRLSAKRKIHEWLILLLRCLFLLLLILALARPLLGLKNSGESVARLVLIDNSGSMAAPTVDGISKLTLAERATETLIAASRPGDAVAVQLTVPDPTVNVPRGFDATSGVLRDALGKVAPADGAASVPNAIRTALATLDSARAPQRELHIITDLQRKNWSRGEMDSALVSPNVRIIVHRVESAPLLTGSVSVELLDVPKRSIPAGRVTPIRVKLQNNGPAVAHVRLNSADDSGKNVSREVEIASGAAVAVPLTFSFPNPGFHWAQIWVEGDAAPTANRSELGFWCTDVRKVLFVGAKDDFGALPFAVSPGGTADLSGIEADFVGADEARTALASKPLAVVFNWETMPQAGDDAQALQDYVRQGGMLILLPSPGAGVAVSQPAPAWLDANPEALVTAPEGEPVVLLREGDPLWENLRDATGQPKLGRLRVFQFQSVKTGAVWDKLIASAKGGALFARRNLDRGQIYVSGLAFTPKWSSLPLKAGFVVLVQNAVFGNASEAVPVQAIQAAQPFHFDLPNVEATVKALAGSALDWHGDAHDFEGFPRAGVYDVNQRDRVDWAAVSGNPDEAVADYLPDAPVPLLVGLPHTVIPLVRASDITRADVASNAGLSLYRWLLLLALLVLFAETWAANVRSSDQGRRLFRSLLSTARKKEGTREKVPAPVKS